MPKRKKGMKNFRNIKMNLKIEPCPSIFEGACTMNLSRVHKLCNIRAVWEDCLYMRPVIEVSDLKKEIEELKERLNELETKCQALGML